MSELLLEDGRLRNVIRTIVKDLVTVYKEEDEGEFYLPNYLYDDIDAYNFPKFEHDVVLQFNMIENYDIDDYKTDGQLWRNDSIIEITVEYNPDKKYDISIYKFADLLNSFVTSKNALDICNSIGCYNIEVHQKSLDYGLTYKNVFFIFFLN